MPKERILIADDEEHVRNLCARIIGREGYDITTANDGYQAIELAQTEPFDLFLTDIQMPRMSGLETAQFIRAVQPDIVCVVMTGFGTMERAIQAIRLGFTEFVEKPFKPKDLIGAINRALEVDRLRRENVRLNALVPLFELNKTLMSNIAPDDLAHKVLDMTCFELKADIGLLMLYERNQWLRLSASSGIDPETVPEPLIKTLLDERQQLLVDNRQVDKSTGHALCAALGVQHLLFTPLLAMDTIVGALILAKSNRENAFAPGDAELLSVLGGQAAVALQNARLFEDIQRAYRELQKVDHIKSEFINIAAHELRTPLAILLGHADLLENDEPDPSRKSRLKIIVRNAMRLRELIQSLFDMRTLQSGEYQINVSAFELDALVEDVLQDLRPWAEDKNLSVEIDIPLDLAPVQSDRAKIHIALGNLLQNAIKFSLQDGHIGILVQDQDQECWVTVWDTGKGIPETEFENIFKPFYQVEDSLTREHEGIGLGLSITKGMVELCGGRIWVESESDKGSRFTFTLPKQID